MTQPVPHSSNRVLGSLAAADLTTLMPHLRFVDLPRGMVLFEAGVRSAMSTFLTPESFPSSSSWHPARWSKPQ
jgi:hypothetical protein